MIYRGRVSKGKVVLENPADLPDGTEVVVRLAATKTARKNGRSRPVGRTKSSAVSNALLKLAGSVKDLPADASRHIDHIL
jgi:hypothetical protein